METVKIKGASAKNIMRARGFDTARQLADENKCAYGLCVVDALYYIGDATELGKLPVVISEDFASEDSHGN